MQRRDTYRLPIPASCSATCFFRLSNDQAESAMAVVDISYGGIGLLGFSPDLDLTAGQIIKGCRLELSQTGIIHCDLRIGSQSELTLKNQIKTVRTGCEFTHLKSQDKHLLQRFIFGIEKQQLSAQE